MDIRGAEAILTDLSVDPSAKHVLRRTLLCGSVQLRLGARGPAVHGATIEYLEHHLRGRSPMVWIDGGLLHATFAVEDHSKESSDAVRQFATEAARVVGAEVERAEVIGIVASASDAFMIDH